MQGFDENLRRENSELYRIGQIKVRSLRGANEHGVYIFLFPARGSAPLRISGGIHRPLPMLIPLSPSSAACSDDR